MRNATIILFSALLSGQLLLACETIKTTDSPEADNKKSDKSSPNEKVTDPQTIVFESLAGKALEALKAENIVLARQYIEKGLQQTQKAGRKYELYEARFSLLKGRLELMEGNTTDARRFLGDAMAVFRITKNTPGTFEVRLAQASIEESGGNFAAAQRELDEAQKLLPNVDDANLKGEFTFKQAELMASQMKHKDAAKLFLEAAETFRTIKNPEREADSFVALSTCEEGLEKPREAKNSLNKAYKIYMEAQNREGAVKALHKLAQFSLREEKYKTAKEQLKKVESLYLELGKHSAATKVSQHISSLPE